MIEMPSDLDRPWEPWEPKVGDKVQVKLNGECAVKFRARDDLGIVHGEYGHMGVDDGARGVVIKAPVSITNPSHRHAVAFDVPIHWQGEVVWGSCYAAIELEPLEDNHA